MSPTAAFAPTPHAFGGGGAAAPFGEAGADAA